jgi:hypothetical protein
VAPKKSKDTELSVFKGKEAKLNRAIFQILTSQEPQAVWDIFRNVAKQRGLKRKRYAVVEVRVKALESQGYLAVAGERETKQGNKTPLFKMTVKAKLALTIGPRTINDVMSDLDETSAAIILEALSKRTLS